MKSQDHRSSKTNSTKKKSRSPDDGSESAAAESLEMSFRVFFVCVAMIALGLLLFYYFTGRGFVWTFVSLLGLAAVWIWYAFKINSWNLSIVKQNLKTWKKSLKSEESDGFRRMVSYGIDCCLFVLKRIKMDVINRLGEFIDGELNERPKRSRNVVRKTGTNAPLAKNVSFDLREHDKTSLVEDDEDSIHLS